MVSPQQTDEDLARAAQKGDLSALSLLLERYESPLLNYGRRFLPQHADIEDAVQEIFIKAYTNINSFDATRRFHPWIYRLAHNEFINHTAKRARHWQEILSFDALWPHFVSPPIKNHPDELWRTQAVEKCLSVTPEKYREILILFYWENLSYEEISDVLQIPVSAVGVRLLRGRQWLKINCTQLSAHL